MRLIDIWCRHVDFYGHCYVYVHIVHLLFGLFAQGANVLVGVDSLVKLADFGCSKRAKETTAVTIEGSIPWMAPEVGGVHRNIAELRSIFVYFYPSFLFSLQISRSNVKFNI